MRWAAILAAESQEIAMADFPFTWPLFQAAKFFQGPTTFDQPINPGWFDVDINNYAGNPQIEKDVVEKVASFGKQLGILTEAVLELAGNKPRPDSSAITRLREIAAQVEAQKTLNKASLAEHAAAAMKRLAKAEPDAARRIAAVYADKPSSATSRSST
jgi:hypothetical protein